MNDEGKLFYTQVGEKWISIVIHLIVLIDSSDLK